MWELNTLTGIMGGSMRVVIWMLRRTKCEKLNTYKVLRSGSSGGLAGLLAGSILGPVSAFFAGYLGEYVLRKGMKQLEGPLAKLWAKVPKLKKPVLKRRK